MSTIAVLGAGGQTGRLLVGELVGAGHRVLALTRHPERLEVVAGTRAGIEAGAWGRNAEVEVREVPEVRECAEGREGDEVRGVREGAEGREGGEGPEHREIAEGRADAAARLAAALEGAEALVDLAGPYARRGPVGLEAALLAGAHYLDACLEPTASRWVHEQHERLRAAGITAVTGAGFPDAVLDLLALSAVGAVDGAREVHLATTFPDRGWLRAAVGPATREALADLLERPASALVDHRHVEEPVGEARRLAWFPRPVGLAHAAGIPGIAVGSLARRDPDLATVRTYLAMSGWRAELLQLAGNAARWDPARRRLRRIVRGTGVAPTAAARQQVRWACVAETRGAQGTVRAWANGRDPAAAAAASLGVVAGAVLEHPRPGARTPGELAPAGVLLDELSAGRELRWAVIRPDTP